MAAKYYEVRVRASVDPGELFAFVMETGCLGSYETEDGSALFWPEERWTAETAAILKEAMLRLGASHGGESFLVEEVPDRDWNEQWASALAPVRIGRRLLVRQSWNTAEVPAGGFELIVDPKRAFGSGYHATTQLIIERLEESMTGGERVLDVGTGTGILVMTALKMGASWALAVDRDPEAAECAMENAAVNGFGRELEIRAAALEDLHGERFDLVLANLDRNTLLRGLWQLAGLLRPGGRLIISGIQGTDLQDIAEAAAAEGLAMQARSKRDDWMMLELRACDSIGKAVGSQ